MPLGIRADDDGVKTKMIHNLVGFPEEFRLLDLRNLAHQFCDCLMLREVDVTQLVPVRRITGLIGLQNNTLIRTRSLSRSQKFGSQVLPSPP